MLNPIWKTRSYIEETAGNNRLTEYLVELVADYGTTVFLEKTSNGYSREIKGVEIEMKKPKHFFDLLTHKPVEGYLKRVDIGRQEKIVDGGAFPGEFSILAAKKGVEVVALEPDPENAAVMRENIRMNGVEDMITVLEKGLWSERTEKKFERDSCLGVGSRVDEGSEFEIELDTLDRIIKEHGEPDLVKLDIEGAEVEALEGAENTMKEVEPEFTIASYHRTEEGKTVKAVERILENHGYSTITEYPKHLTTYATKSVIEEE
jgi:FkbM family methyltransferase